MERTNRFFPVLFSLVLLSEMYFSFHFNVLLQLGVLTLIVFSLKRIKVPPSVLSQATPLVVLFLLGFVGLLFQGYPLKEVVKDILHFCKPLLALSIGYFITRSLPDYRAFFRLIVTVALLAAAIHIFNVFFVVGIHSSIEDVREGFLDNFIELFAMVILWFGRKEFPLFGPRKRLLFLALLGLSSALYFSRSMFVVAILLTVSALGYSRLNKTALKAFVLVGIVVGGLFVYLSFSKPARNSKGIEAFLYKIKNAPSEVFNAKVDRDNHRELWDHWRAYEAKRAFDLMRDQPQSWVVGTGHGSLINLKFRAPLDGPDGHGMRYISIMHNGYVFVFYKTGLIGLCVLLFFLIRLYRYLYRPPIDERHAFVLRLLSSIGLFYFFTTLIITGVYIPKDCIMLFLGGLLAVEWKLRMPQGQSSVSAS